MSSMKDIDFIVLNLPMMVYHIKVHGNLVVLSVSMKRKGMNHRVGIIRADLME